MKRITLSILVLFFCTTSLQAQITQEEADIIVLERMSAVMELYTIYALEDVQTSYEITTSIGEMLELDYPCWVYYADFKEKTNGKYLIVKESNGNLLEVNTKNDEGPEELEEWRMVDEIPFSLWERISTIPGYIELKFYPSKNILKISSDPPLHPYLHALPGNCITGYYVIEDRVYMDIYGTYMEQCYWTIEYISETEMLFRFPHPGIPEQCRYYHFVCQTEFTEI